MRTDWYHCSVCDVYGQGATCWACKSPTVERNNDADLISWEIEQAARNDNSCVVEAVA